MTTPTPKKISELVVLSTNQLASNDYVVVVDESLVAPSPSQATKRTLLSSLKSFFIPGTFQTASGSTTSAIANGVSQDITVSNVSRAYVLAKITTSHAAWVVLYNSSASRDSDSTRTETTDPLPGSGVIAEVITGSGTEQIITPGVVGWNESDNTVYAKVVNKSGSEATITITLTFVPLTSA